MTPNLCCRLFCYRQVLKAYMKNKLSNLNNCSTITRECTDNPWGQQATTILARIVRSTSGIGKIGHNFTPDSPQSANDPFDQYSVLSFHNNWWFLSKNFGETLLPCSLNSLIQDCLPPFSIWIPMPCQSEAFCAWFSVLWRQYVQSWSENEAKKYMWYLPHPNLEGVNKSNEVVLKILKTNILISLCANHT